MPTDWDSKHNFSSGTCRTLATVWGRLRGNWDCCSGYQPWLAASAWSGGGKKKQVIWEWKEGKLLLTVSEQLQIRGVSEQRCWLLQGDSPPFFSSICFFVFDIWNFSKPIAGKCGRTKRTSMPHLVRLSAVKLLVQGLYFPRVVTVRRQKMQTKYWGALATLRRKAGFESVPITKPENIWCLEKMDYWRALGYSYKFSPFSLGFYHQQLPHTSMKTFYNVQDNDSGFDYSLII